MGNTFQILEARRVNHLNRSLRRCIKLLGDVATMLERVERNTLAESYEKEQAQAARLSLEEVSRQIEGIAVPRIPTHVTSIA